MAESLSRTGAEPIARVLRKDPVKCRVVFEPLPGKRPNGFASINTVKPVKVLSRGLCFIGVQRVEEMPLKDGIGKRNNSAARFLEAAPVAVLCSVVAAASMAAGDWPLSPPDKLYAR